MSKYSLTIKKGILELSVSTDDKELVDLQLGKWIKDASDYLRKIKSREGRERVASQISSDLALSEQKIDEQLKRAPKYEPIEMESLSEEKVVEKDLDVLYKPKYEEKPATTPKVEEVKDFDSILDSSMNTPQEELSFKPTPSIKKDNAFLNYIGGRKSARKMDYLLLTAYYFTQYEQKPRFTIKQLNAKLMQNLAVIIDHAVLQEAINRGYIECLPDLTGVVGASEYRLTSYGEKFLLEN